MAYAPSVEELDRFTALLRARRPSEAAYRGYRKAVSKFFASNSFPRGLQINGCFVAITGAMLMASELFRRTYVVCDTDAKHFRVARPHSDAMAVSMLDINLPPLVLVPGTTRPRLRSKAFRSVLEHEFVHINQMLMGTFCLPHYDRPLRTRLRGFYERMRVEYEANILQLTPCPYYYPHRLGLSLDRWCALRGYAEALEEAVTGIACSAESRADEFLETLPDSFAPGLKRNGIDPQHAIWFQENWQFHLSAAIRRVREDRPRLVRTPGFRSIVSWSKQKFKRRRN